MIPQTILDQAIQDYYNGDLTNTIALKYNITKRTLYNHIPYKRPPIDHNLADKHIAYGLYLKGQHPRDIAMQLGLTKNTIYKYIRQLK